MTRLLKVILYLLLVLSAAPGIAQQRTDFNVVLLPVSGSNDVPGAFGSIWRTEFTLAAVGGEVLLAQPTPCLSCPPLVHVAPGFPLHSQPGGAAGDPPGALLYIAKTTSMNAWFGLRSRDISREADDWGTEIPVVGESDVFTDRVVLVDVPFDTRFRQTLRMYDIDDRSDTLFHLEISDMQGHVLATRDVAATAMMGGFPDFPRGPAVAEIYDLASLLPSAITVERVNILVSANANVRFWAFVSITNNVTQHVTIISPQH